MQLCILYYSYSQLVYYYRPIYISANIIDVDNNNFNYTDSYYHHSVF